MLLEFTTDVAITMWNLAVRLLLNKDKEDSYSICRQSHVEIEG